VPRTVTLVLVVSDGSVLGALEPFEVATPWWQDADDVVSTARAVHGIDVTILRMLGASLPRPHGGDVTYLAELDGAAPEGLTVAADVVSDDHPLRQTWARPGGPAADLAWADEQLRRADAPRTGRAQQVRAWNLSSLWRLPTADGHVWLKVVPAFFAHEGDVLARIDIGPTVVAREGPRSLLRDVPGADVHDPTAAHITTMIRLLVGEQVRWLDRTDELLALGAPDWRGDSLISLATDVVERTAPELDPIVLARARRLVDGLGDRFAAITSCGLGDSLVHGDFHAGNTRSDGVTTVVLDWGDCGVGHPMLDEAAATERLPRALAEVARNSFEVAWRHALPGSDPTRAAALLGPVAALRQAVVYRRFLDHIEPSERPFHRDDPAVWIARAVR